MEAVRRDGQGHWVSVDVLEEGVVVLASDGSVVSSNVAAERILGRPLGEFATRADLHVVTDDGQPIRRRDWPGVAAIREDRVVRDVVVGVDTPAGERRWITVTARPLPHSGQPGEAAALVTFTDITRVRDAQQTADESLALLHRVFETSPVSVGVTRIGPPDDGRFVMANLALTRMVGWSADELLGMTNNELIHPDDRDKSRLARGDLLAGRLPEDRVELRLLRRDGTSVWCLLQRTMVRDAHGVPRFVFGQVDDLTERRAAEATMVEQALTDWLTGLPNRRRLQQHLNDALAKRPGAVGVLFVDLDGFKQVNDRFGHEVGDHALRHAAQHLARTLDDGCTLARLGGDEFVVVLDKGNGEAVADLAARLRALEIPSGAPDGRQLRISVGAVVAREDETPEHVLRRADAAMYRSKAAAGVSPSARTGTGWV